MKPSVAAGLQAKAAQAQASELAEVKQQLAEVSEKMDLLMNYFFSAKPGKELEPEVKPEVQEPKLEPEHAVTRPAGRGKYKK